MKAKLLAAWLMGSALVLFAQDPQPGTVTITGTPQRDFHYNCISDIGGGPKFDLRFAQFPFGSLSLNQPGTPDAATDTIKPVISSVIYSGGADVLTGNIKIQAAANGVPFTVKAGDDQGVMFYRLFVDGLQGPQDGNGVKALPFPFYVRWNDANTAPGVHMFKLQVFDAAGNVGEVNWTMVR